ncbi:MAG: bifunctional folylpolyglutamate synthase/dihydrofolate synthase [Duncaniella sp.]|nr:bifunctional folylpolyglutamate synthase/dihydrofolate synthase [Muribaculum sp.]MCM1255719.1 bifunctional folylpolyglutamate synthase/dihydrofolate synthase [Duncaniella sp.]
MTYSESIDYLYNSLPVFQREGASAYKPGLSTSIALDNLFGNPHRNYPTIHIAGTNGKGSTAHTLAAVLQSAGYKVGLYTSPHLFDFRERIRVNGEKIPHEKVVSFVVRWLGYHSDSRYRELSPSFFELTSTMAFEYFARQNVDVAVIETGLGGRLDSTNIITPVLSVITNISLDHTSLLGNSLEKIAYEKAGIIKPGVPVVIGERQEEIAHIFEEKGNECRSDVIFATACTGEFREDGIYYTATQYGDFTGELKGDYQIKNTATVLESLRELKKIGFKIPSAAVKNGFGNVTGLTHLMGRWMTIANHPKVVIDTGHNEGGWRYITEQLGRRDTGTVHLIIGFAADKDIAAVLHLIADLPISFKLYFSSPSVKRGLNAYQLATLAAVLGLTGEIIPDVNEALESARRHATNEDDMILVAGSNFLIADLREAMTI